MKYEKHRFNSFVSCHIAHTGHTGLHHQMLCGQSRRCVALTMLACRECCFRGRSVNYAAICMPPHSPPPIKAKLGLSKHRSTNCQIKEPNEPMAPPIQSPQDFESKALPNVKLLSALHNCERAFYTSDLMGRVRLRLVLTSQS